MTLHKFTALLFIILLFPATTSAQPPPGYQKVLEQFYDECSSSIYQEFILQGYEEIIWRKIINETEYDLALLYNDSVISRIKRLNKRGQNRTFRISEKNDSEINALKKSFNMEGGGRNNLADINRIAIAEITVSDVRRTKNDFYVKLDLKLTTRNNSGRPFQMTREYQGNDAEIDRYVVGKYYSPFVTFSFIVYTLFIALAIALISKLRKYGVVREVNLSFFVMGALIYTIAIIVFIYLTYLKHDLLSSTTFFKGAEVHFFVDTNAGLYFEPEAKGDLNFTKISALLAKRIFDNVSTELYMGRALSEKLSDSIFAFINRIHGFFSPGESPILEFVELKKSDYFYKFYTFTFDEDRGQDKLRPLSEGRFGEIEADYNKNLEQIGRIHKDNQGQSSLIKPLLQLIKLLDEKKAEDKWGKMKRFIIILTDADEGYEGNIKELLKHIGFFYKKKDQYLRVFSILFPNLPKSEDKIYYHETGKLVLLSKISEMIVNLNANKGFNVEKFKRENQRYYQSLNLPRDDQLEQKYYDKLNELNIFVKHGRVPSMEEIAGQRILMDYIRDKERQYIDMIKEAGDETERGGKIQYQDFFIYTYVNNMYCMEHLGNSMSSDCKDRDCLCNGLEFDQKDRWLGNRDIRTDYNTTRTKYFSLTKNKKNTEDLNLISDVFVDQFIFISFDKERLASAINNWLSFLTIMLGLVFAWLQYRYRYHVNYKFGWGKVRIDTLIIAAILLVQLSLYSYIHATKGNWVIYGNFPLALFVSLGFAICIYIIPQAINLVLLKKVSAERDVLFSFEQPRWLRRVDRYVFDFFLLPVMTISIFLVIASPVLKESLSKLGGIHNLLPDFLFLDYNNIIDAFFIVWSIIGVLFILRSLVYSAKIEKHFKF